MTQPNSRARQRAEQHRARAASYRDDADLLLEQYGKGDSAAALIYESAKQCINAIANRNGENPGATGAKRRYLESIASEPPGDGFDLEKGWQAATQLHVHADRGHLTADRFREAWQLAQTFVDDMLAIYDEGG